MHHSLGLALLAVASAAFAGTVEPSLALRAERSQQFGQRPIGIIVELDGRPDLTALAAQLAGRPPAQRPGSLAAQLRLDFERAAPPVRAALERLGAAQIEPLWLPHAYAAQMAPKNLRELAATPGVLRVYADMQLKAPFRRGEVATPATLKRRLANMNQDATVSTPGPPFDAQGWRGELPTHLAALGVAEYWQRGVSGAGIAVAVIDSGVDGRDRLLMTRYRGGRNDWFDPYREHPWPHDGGGHGTNVAHLIAGGVQNIHGSAPVPVGVAPNATWIASRIYDDSGVGRLSAVHRIYQWVLDPDGRAETADAPRIVNNAWGLPQTVGRCELEFARDFAALRAAGIHVVFAAGNEGPAENTSMSPANNPGVLAVGALAPSGQAADQSARGPSACGGGAYPQVLAPGVDIESADPAGRVMGEPMRVTGTSFASALASGMLALLASETPSASLEQRERALAAALAPAPTTADSRSAPTALAWRPVLGDSGSLEIDATTLKRMLPWTARLLRIEIEAKPASGRLETLSAERLRYSAEPKATDSAEPAAAAPFGLLAHTVDGRRWRIAVEPQRVAAVAGAVPSRRISVVTQEGQAAQLNPAQLAGTTGTEPINVRASQTIRGGQVTVLDDGSVQYTPRPGFKGVDQFVCTLLAADGAPRSRVQVAVTVR